MPIRTCTDKDRFLEHERTALSRACRRVLLDTAMQKGVVLRIDRERVGPLAPTRSGHTSSRGYSVQRSW